MSDETVWVEDRNWTTVVRPGVVTCSFPRCEGKAVAILRRRTRRGTRAYYYCPDHLYGRKVDGDRVMQQVHAASTSAERGFTGGDGL